VACGNNKISRDYLTSQPASTQSQSDRFFAALRAPETVRVGGKDREAYFSRFTSTSNTTEYFLDDKGRKTFDPSRHVHVIHDDGKSEVRMHITDRQDGRTLHTDHVRLPRPSGNAVNAAEARLVSILRSKKQ